jgi:hypothetical protein
VAVVTGGVFSNLVKWFLNVNQDGGGGVGTPPSLYLSAARHPFTQRRRRKVEILLLQ